MKKSSPLPLILITVFLVLQSCNGNAQKKNTTEKKKFLVEKTPEQWRSILTPLQYHVLRKKGTERPHTGKYNKWYADGVYHCAGCNTAVYDAKNKYDSGSGWPSFDAAIYNAVDYVIDLSHNMQRMEIICASCGGHLGHKFLDGPKKTTGQRHCINAAALVFKAR